MVEQIELTAGPFKRGKTGLEFYGEIYEFPNSRLRNKAYKEFAEADRADQEKNVFLVEVGTVRKKYAKYFVGQGPVRIKFVRFKCRERKIR